MKINSALNRNEYVMDHFPIIVSVYGYQMIETNKSTKPIIL
jgi:hypothetical protein